MKPDPKADFPFSYPVQEWLDRQVTAYDQSFFIEGDPISVPHRFTGKQDREIAGLFTAIIAWGLRKTIISNATLLMERMDWAPYDFILHHKPQDRKRLYGFVHRTFQTDDLLYLVERIQRWYQTHESLEDAFLHDEGRCIDMYHALSGFHTHMFDSTDVMERTRKHISTPVRGSACKRLNMFLRWMVRNRGGVDFGIWERISPSQLVIPLDVHVSRVARQLSLLDRKQDDWTSAIMLTEKLREFDPEDPVKYDFALFGWAVSQGKR